MWWRRVRYVLALTALCAIATCPRAKRSCTARNEAREARDLLDYLADRVADAVATTGKLPATPAGPTPQPSCCEQGGTCAPDPAVWAQPGWQELKFSIDGAYRYTYSYAPDANRMTGVLRAVGDLDCDGDTSLYEVKLTIEDGKLVKTWTETRPYE